MRLRYEDLCANPAAVLQDVHRFAGVSAIAEADLNGREQHVLGNRMRLVNINDIRVDEKWKTLLKPEDLAAFERIAGPLNRSFRYE